MSELAPSPASLFDPLDLEDLWPIVTELITATQSTSISICALANTLAKDHDASAGPLRQHLLDIRARLVYLLADVAYSVLTNTHTLISSGAIIMSRNTPHAPTIGIVTSLRPQWISVLDACVTNRARVDDCLEAWAAFYTALSDYWFSRSRYSGPVTSFLRALGAFGPEPTASSTSTNSLSSETAATTVQSSLPSIGESLTQIEAFWRKRRDLFQSRDDGLGAGQRVPNYRSWTVPGEISNSLEPQFYSCIDSLRRPEPIIPRYPSSLSDAAKSTLAWRALLAA